MFLLLTLEDGGLKIRVNSDNITTYRSPLNIHDKTLIFFNKESILVKESVETIDRLLQEGYVYIKGGIQNEPRREDEVRDENQLGKGNSQETSVEL